MYILLYLTLLNIMSIRFIHVFMYTSSFVFFYCFVVFHLGHNLFTHYIVGRH